MRADAFMSFFYYADLRILINIATRGTIDEKNPLYSSQDN